ncbi:MAG: hypothetical protein HYZ49_02310 [Chloroflexi bacterium]|nr:hypothetical protein [Chloroflexota bacterium]
MDTHRRKPWGLFLLGLSIGGLALFLCLGLAAHGLVANEVRCYSVGQPLTPMEKVLLEGRAVDCIDNRCWLVLKFNRAGGASCFFSRTAASMAVEGEARPTASQTPSGH